MKRMTLRLDPWKWAGVVVVGGTPQDAKAYARDCLGADMDIGDHSAGHACVEYGKPWVIWLASKDVAALAHEAFHIASGVLEGRGLSHSRQSEEAYTYTMEFIIRAVLHQKRWREVCR